MCIRGKRSILLLSILALTGCAHLERPQCDVVDSESDSNIRIKPRTELKLSFDKAPVVVPLHDQYWMLKEDLVFRMERLCTPKEKYEIRVPAGFVTDLASISFPFSMIFNKTGRYAPAGIVHDYLYWMQPCGTKIVEGEEVTGRNIADRILKEAIKASDRFEEDLAEEKGKPIGWTSEAGKFVTRNLMKFAVMFGGNSSWKSNIKAKEEQHVRSIKMGQRESIRPGMRWDLVEKEKGEKLEAVKDKNFCEVFQDEW